MARKALIAKQLKLRYKYRQDKKSGKRMKSRTKFYNRCKLCGRSKSYMRDFGMCRECFKKNAREGKIMGLKKASW